VELLSPLQLAWLGLLAPLIVLYILKRRRQQRVVGSTLLWEQALRDLRAERPWKKLIPHLALLLQALVILLGALALARPAGAGRVPAGARVAVVVDTSASMAADADGQSRIERARSEARGLARGLAPGGQMMLIDAAAQPAVLSPPTQDATALERAIAQLDVHGGGSDIEAAVALAADRLRGAAGGSRIVLLTDAALDGEVPLDGRTAPVEVRRVGGTAPNTAIAAADVRARPSDDAPDRAEVFVRLTRFAQDDADVFVTATVVQAGDPQGNVVASRRVRIAAGQTESVVMGADLPPDASGRASIVRIQITAAEGSRARDALALDDVVVVPSPGARRLPVFLVGAAPAPVERALRADSEVELFATTLESLAGREGDAPPLDGLVIYVGQTPDTPPPGDSMVIGPVSDRVFELELGPVARGASIVTWDDEDPRLRFVQLSDVHVRAIRPVIGAAGRALVSTDAGPAIASVERPNGETTLVSFDPSQSDWPDRQSFVVFIRNVLERARNRRAAGGVASGSVGEALRVPAPDGETVTVVAPDGTRAEAVSRGGVAIIDVPAVPGVFRVSVGDRRLHALRNLLDPSESDLSARARFTRGGRATVAAAAEGNEHAESWPWLAAGLLIVLLLEVLWATRRSAT